MAAPKIRSIFCYIRQMAALQILQQATLPFKVCDAFLSPKPARACVLTNCVLAICTYARSTRKFNYRFLDIQIILYYLGIASVVHRAAPSYSDAYKSVPTSGPGNSSCLVVKIETPDAKVSGSKERIATIVSNDFRIRHFAKRNLQKICSPINMIMLKGAQVFLTLWWFIQEATNIT
ncbi:hypothetical protein AVEN_24617-1 [Araneus ventricosus]|uniref:Uncharacterized protein n=1 Tax=Araneus ventricosus TaxID=182803 RepID=A0A4Y2IJD4_ARAVE|nr:hypothetical protein AVEN_24617-1 [Araneus ventricosus]